MKFNIGDKVILKKGAPLYKSSSSIISTSRVKENKISNITRYAKGTKHPYNTMGDLGWMNESDIELYKDEKSKYDVEIEIVDKENLIDYLLVHTDKIVMIDSKQLKEILEYESKSKTL